MERAVAGRNPLTMVHDYHGARPKDSTFFQRRTPQMNEPVHQYVGPYKVITFHENKDAYFLGKGSFGNVYKAYLGEQIYAAKKVERDALHPFGRNKRIYENELIPLTKQLRHPNIIKIFHTEFISTDCWMILEFCEVALHTLFKTKWISPVQRKAVIYQAVAGVEYLHANKLAHRDIKANNVLVKKFFGQWPWVKVTDFSLARDFSNQANSAMSTVIGNRHWLAPELLDREGNLICASQASYKLSIDIYSLGLLASFCCMNSSGQSYMQHKIVCGQLQKQKPSIGLISQYLKQYWDEELLDMIPLIERMVSFDASKRPRNVVNEIKTAYCEVTVEIDKILEVKSGMTALASPQPSGIISVPTQDQTRMLLLERLALMKYYPHKIEMRDVMCIGQRVEPTPFTFAHLPWHILQNIVLVDHRARDSCISKCMDASSAVQSDSNDSFDESDDETQQRFEIHPLDVQLLLLQCCDPLLSQQLTVKMFKCRLALPFIVPYNPNHLMCLIWTLKAVTAEWKDRYGSIYQAPLTKHPMTIISFMRIGRPSLSKSKLLNKILSDKQHDTFCNEDSANGRNVRKIANGLIEMSHYFPSGLESDPFQSAMMFMNLRGDAIEYKWQTEMLLKISSICIICVDAEAVESLGDSIRKLINHKTIVLLSSRSFQPSKNDQVKSGYSMCKEIMCGHVKNIVKAFKRDRGKSPSEVKRDLIAILSSMLLHLNDLEKRTLEEHSKMLAKTYDFLHIDEQYHGCCKQALSCVNDLKHENIFPTSKSKQTVLPLQDELWQTWSDLQRQLCRIKQDTDGTSLVQAAEKIELEMSKCRREQHTCSQRPHLFIDHIFTYLQNNIDNKDAINCFLQEIKLELDQMSTDKLKPIQMEYRKLWIEYNSAKQSSDQPKARTLQGEMKACQEKIARTSFGLEHLFREFGQLFEASPKSYNYLPEIMAKLFLYGIPFELLDGDAGCVPMNWVKNVLGKLADLIGDDKIFVLAVIGIQSSGKSTLLNTMFGLENTVSAGRCTRGIYAQLLSVDRRSNLPFRYVFVLDSEGLRAPEMKTQKYSHDNELATFIIGLSDLSIVNLKGENTVEMQDILQITVHAFLRMKLADSSNQRRCIFVHQNVGALNADEKMTPSVMKLQEDLDQMTKEAAEAEDVKAKVQCFSDVIQFNASTDVAYMSDLYYGDPPMAPINPGYSEKVKSIRESIFERALGNNCITITDFSKKLETLWQAVLSDDFVFTFKNTLSIRAHLILERKFSELKYQMEQCILDYIRGAENDIRRSLRIEDLDTDVRNAISTVVERIGIILDEHVGLLEHFFQNTEYNEILSEFREQRIKFLRDFAENEKDRVQRRLLTQRDQIYQEMRHMERLEDHRKTFASDISAVAKELSRRPHKGTLEEKFYGIWCRHVEPEPSRISTQMVRKRMETILIRELVQDGRSVDFILLGVRSQHERSKDIMKGITTHDIANEHFKLKTGVAQRLFKADTGKAKEKVKEKIAHRVNDSLEKISRELENICDAEDDKFFYVSCEKFVQDSLQEFDSWVKEKKKEYQAINTLKAKFVSHAVNCAILRYKTLFEGPETYFNGTNDTINIEQDMESILLREFGAVGQVKAIRPNMVYLHDRNLPLTAKLKDSIKEEEISEKYVHFKNDQTELSRFVTEITYLLNELMRRLDNCLECICSDESKFYTAHGTKFVKEILHAFADQNDKDMAFDFTWECQGYIAAFAVHHAILRFEAMNIKYEIKHGHRAKLEQYKAHSKIVFRDQVQQIEACETFAVITCNVIEKEVENYINSQMSKRIKNKLLQGLGFTKRDLLVKVLTDLYERNDFVLYKEYIQNAYDFTTKWLKLFTEKFAFKRLQNSEDSLYVNLARREIQTIFETILEDIRSAAASTQNLSSCELKRRKWIQTLCDLLRDKRIFINEKDLVTAQDLDVRDEVLMIQTVEKQMNHLQKKITTKYSELEQSDVIWENDLPEIHVMKTLWGCPEQCPFCNAPCKYNSVNHQEKHECDQHRPRALSGCFDLSNKSTLIQVCNVYVTTDIPYVCNSVTCRCKSKGRQQNTAHKHSDYKKYYPGWKIKGDDRMVQSAYWKWFIFNFKDDLEKHYSYVIPQLPRSWSNISEEDAIESLP